MPAIKPALSPDLKARIAAVRHFSRFYTPLIGVFEEHYLKTPFSPTEGRVTGTPVKAETAALSAETSAW